MILSSEVEDMQNSYSSPNILPRESPVCVFQKRVIRIFIVSGFKK